VKPWRKRLAHLDHALALFEPARPTVPPTVSELQKMARDCRAARNRDRGQHRHDHSKHHATCWKLPPGQFGCRTKLAKACREGRAMPL